MKSLEKACKTKKRNGEEVCGSLSRCELLSFEEEIRSKNTKKESPRKKRDTKREGCLRRQPQGKREDCNRAQIDREKSTARKKRTGGECGPGKSDRKCNREKRTRYLKIGGRGDRSAKQKVMTQSGLKKRDSKTRNHTSGRGRGRLFCLRVCPDSGRKGIHTSAVGRSQRRTAKPLGNSKGKACARIKAERNQQTRYEKGEALKNLGKTACGERGGGGSEKRASRGAGRNRSKKPWNGRGKRFFTRSLRSRGGGGWGDDAVTNAGEKKEICRSRLTYMVPEAGGAKGPPKTFWNGSGKKRGERKGGRVHERDYSLCAATIRGKKGETPRNRKRGVTHMVGSREFAVRREKLESLKRVQKRGKKKQNAT